MRIGRQKARAPPFYLEKISPLKKFRTHINRLQYCRVEHKLGKPGDFVKSLNSKAKFHRMEYYKYLLTTKNVGLQSKGLILQV
jgi:hypothetical protein